MESVAPAGKLHVQVISAQHVPEQLENFRVTLELIDNGASSGGSFVYSTNAGDRVDPSSIRFQPDSAVTW